MNILLTGASGFIGSHIKHALLSDTKNKVITPSHKEADFNTFTQPENWLPLLQNIDTVINSVGIINETNTQHFSLLHSDAPIALFQACTQSKVKRIIQISALGADDNAFTAYQLSKLTADDVLRDLPLSWFVLRPSLVYGNGGASLALFKRLASFPFIPLPSAGKQKIQPVYIDDLVATVSQCLHAHNDCQTIDVVGPHAITLADYIQTIRLSQGKSKALIMNVSSALLLSLSHLGKHLFPLMHPDNLRMLQQGNTADVKPLTRFLRRSPLSVKTALNIMEDKQ